VGETLGVVFLEHSLFCFVFLDLVSSLTRNPLFWLIKGFSNEFWSIRDCVPSWTIEELLEVPSSVSIFVCWTESSTQAEYMVYSNRWISSVQITLTFAGSLPAGRFFDSHGARSLVITGTTLSVASLVAIACELSLILIF